jgi:hypothetical protein
VFVILSGHATFQLVIDSILDIKEATGFSEMNLPAASSRVSEGKDLF